MPIQTGTHTIADLVANTFAGEAASDPQNMTALEDAIRRDLEAHNQRLQELLAAFSARSSERQTVYGTNAEMEFHSADEYSRGPTQKIAVGSRVEFPLDKFQLAVGFTADYLRRASVQDVAIRTVAVRRADVNLVQRKLREAFFGATNYTWNDRLVDGTDLAVKRLVNADSAPIPNGPNGEVFDGTSHTHYLASDWSAATADAKASDIADLIGTVTEHGHSEGLTVFINTAQESDVRGATDFVALLYPNTVSAPGGTEDRGQGVIDITNANNRLIGYFRGVPVRVKPWVPANYLLANATADGRKPLRQRVSAVAAEAAGLFIAGTIINHPLQAEYAEHFFGFGAWNRTNGAVLYTGGGTYAEPTF